MQIMSEDPSDADLINRVKAGDTEVFASIIERHTPQLAALIRKHVPTLDVEEVIHESFIQAFRSLHTFRGDQPFKHWLVRVAIRRCYDYWRHKRRGKETPVSELGPAHIEWLELVTNAAAKQVYDEERRKDRAREVLEWVLSRLSAEDRLVMTLVHLEGRSVKEVAHMLGWSVVNVKVRVHRSKKKMRDLVSQYLKFEGEK